MKIHELTPGDRFTYPSLGKTATLLSLGAGGARIKYDSDSRQVRIEDSRTGETATFEAPGRAVVVCDASDIERLPAPKEGLPS